MEPTGLDIVGKCSTTELYLQTFIQFFFNFEKLGGRVLPSWSSGKESLFFYHGHPEWTAGLPAPATGDANHSD